MDSCGAAIFGHDTLIGTLCHVPEESAVIEDEVQDNSALSLVGRTLGEDGSGRVGVRVRSGYFLFLRRLWRYTLCLG